MKGVGYAPHVKQETQEYLGAPSNSYGATVSHRIAITLLSIIYHKQRMPEPRDFRKIGSVVYDSLAQGFN